MSLDQSAPTPWRLAIHLALMVQESAEGNHIYVRHGRAAASFTDDLDPGLFSAEERKLKLTLTSDAELAREPN